MWRFDLLWGAILTGGLGFIFLIGSPLGAAPIDGGEVGATPGASDLENDLGEGLNLDVLGEVLVTQGIADESVLEDSSGGELIGSDEVPAAAGDSVAAKGDRPVYRAPVETKTQDQRVLGGSGKESELNAAKDAAKDKDAPREYFTLSERERKILHEEFETDLFGAKPNTTSFISFLWLTLFATIPLLLLLGLLFWKYRSLGLSRPRWAQSQAELDRERYGRY